MLNALFELMHNLGFCVCDYD
uniref:Uncharacterized protein n=1 Tax=Rhizophora mucronata TaxID=61149 RepID=A0A2P2NMI6_RHIMU